MEKMLLILVLAITVEALVEYAKSIEELAVAHNKRPLVLQLGAVVTSVGLCLLAGADIYAGLGVVFAYPLVGCTLTGIFASRGANYVSDLIGRLRKGGSYYELGEVLELDAKPPGSDVA